MKPLVLFAIISAFVSTSASAVDVPLPNGWRISQGVRKGPEGSFSIFGPFLAPSLDQAVILRNERLAKQGTRMNEKARESIKMPDGAAGLKILFEVTHDGHTYLSPHYFLMTGGNEYFVIKTIPKDTEYSVNAKIIDDHIMQRIEQVSGGNGG